MSTDVATLTNASNTLDTVAKLVRVMEKEGVAWNQLTLPINDQKARRNLALYLKAGCPKMLESNAEGAVLTKAPAEVEKKSVHSLFSLSEAQIVRWRDEWNGEFKLGITEEVFQQLATSIPAWPQDRLVAVVLTYHFDSPQRELEFYWPLIARGQEQSWKWDAFHFDSDHLRWLAGYENVPGLRWEVINLGADCDRKPCDVRSPSTSPGAGVLAAAALFPGWIRAMNGRKVPFVWLPGYEVTLLGHDPWQCVPYVNFDRDSRQVELNAGCDDYASDGWAVPVSLGGQH